MEKEPQGINDLEPFILALETLGRKDLATEALDTFAKASNGLLQYENLSKCYFKLKKYTESIKYGEKSLALSEDPKVSYLIRSNLINVYNQANLPEKALAYIKSNETINPLDIDTSLEKAYTYYLLNRKPEAQKILENTLQKENLDEKTATKIKFNLGTYYLYQDRFQEGLHNFLIEGAKMKLWNVENIMNRNDELDLPFWEGTPDLKHLIIYAEAGIGDEIINIRFMETLKERGIEPYWYAKWHSGVHSKERAGVTELFKKNGHNVITELDTVRNIPGIKWTYSMRLPIYLDLEYKDLWKGPYLKACPEHIDKNQLPENGRPKIGIRWQGNPAYEHDLHRSYHLKELYEHIGNINADFYSLQRDTGTEEIKDFPGLKDLQNNLKTFEDLASYIAQLDIIITSCTSIAHAAAAMGKKTYIFIPISAYYTWSHSGNKSPWYGDNVIQLRQEKPRDWSIPMANLAKEIS